MRFKGIVVCGSLSLPIAFPIDIKEKKEKEKEKKYLNNLKKRIKNKERKENKYNKYINIDYSIKRHFCQVSLTTNLRFVVKKIQCYKKHCKALDKSLDLWYNIRIG